MISLMRIPIAVLAIGIHEYTKAIVSNYKGDNLEVSLNIFKYIDIIGLFFAVYYGFGWGRPVRTSSTYYEDRVSDTRITYLAPSIVNLMLGFLFFALYRYYMVYREFGFYYFFIYGFMQQAYIVNISIAVFNMFPFTPCDGAKLFGTYLTPDNLVKFYSYEPIMKITLLLLIATGYVGHVVNLFIF